MIEIEGCFLVGVGAAVWADREDAFIEDCIRERRETYVVLRSTVPSGAAATVEITVVSTKTSAGALHTTLSMTADVDLGNGRGVRVAWLALLRSTH